MLRMKGWRRTRQMWRAFATSGRLISLASSVFFMAQAKPMQPAADGCPMHMQTLLGGKRIADLVQRQTGACARQSPDPRVIAAQLAPPRIALPLGFKRSSCGLQFDHVIDELRRNPKVPRRSAVAMPFFNHGDNAVPKFNRMWLPHHKPPYLLWSQGITNITPAKS